MIKKWLGVSVVLRYEAHNQNVLHVTVRTVSDTSLTVRIVPTVRRTTAWVRDQVPQLGVPTYAFQLLGDDLRDLGAYALVVGGDLLCIQSRPAASGSS